MTNDVIWQQIKKDLSRNYHYKTYKCEKNKLFGFLDLDKFQVYDKFGDILLDISINEKKGEMYECERVIDNFLKKGDLKDLLNFLLFIKLLKK